MELCGHATLAASKTLLTLNPDLLTIQFQTRWKGQLTAEKSNDEVIITLPIPEIGLTVSNEKILATFCDAAGIEKGEVIGITHVKWGPGSYIIELASKVDLGGLKIAGKDLVSSQSETIIRLAQSKRS